MIDHMGIDVRDYAASKRFYSAALQGIGYTLLQEIPASVTGKYDVAGFGEQDHPDFWISGGGPAKPIMHMAFRVSSRAMVDAFYQSAMAAGGTDNGAPGVRPHYHPTITPPLCSIRMATTSKRSATPRLERCCIS